MEGMYVVIHDFPTQNAGEFLIAKTLVFWTWFHNFQSKKEGEATHVHIVASLRLMYWCHIGDNGELLLFLPWFHPDTYQYI